MVGVAQLVERWLVVPEVAGSSPVIHPMIPIEYGGNAAGPLAAVPATADPDVDLERDAATRPDVDTSWTTVVWNDPVNLMSYVVHVFRSYFGHPEPVARRLMMQVHHDGRAIVASGPREEMERHTEAMHEFGLQATVERAGA
jgi:ATP-dependent Clp protease adaptor protein ClpS